MRKFLFVLLCVTSLAASAQYENTTWEDRLGTGKDKAINMEQQEVWTAALQANGSIAHEFPHDAQHPTAYDEHPRTWNATHYKAWRLLTRNAPFSQFSLYQPTEQGGDMLRYLMYKEPDMALKLMYFDNLMEIFDFYAENLNAMNSLPDYGPYKKFSLSDVLSWKAHYYYTDGKIFPTTVYKIADAYKYYSDAMKAVRQQKDVTQTEVYPYIVMEYFSACQDLYESDKSKYLEQYLQDYTDCQSLCRHMYENLTDSTIAQQKLNEYFPVFDRVHQMFEATGADTRANLEQHFKAKFEEKKGDIGYVNQALALMAQFKDYPDLDEASNISVDYANIAYQHQDQLTHYGALMYGLAKNKELMEMVGDSASKAPIREAMRDAFAKAEQLAPTNEDKAFVCFLIGSAMNIPFDKVVYNPKDSKQVDEWVDQLGASVAYYDKAIELAPDQYKVAANYQLLQIHYTMATGYYNSINDVRNEAGKLTASGYDRASREQAAQTFTIVVDYWNKVTEATSQALARYCYEQDSHYVTWYRANADNFGQNADMNAKKLTGQVERALNPKVVVKQNTTQKAKPTCTEKWHKQLREKAFFAGKAQKCIGCGKMIQ